MKNRKKLNYILKLKDQGIIRFILKLKIAKTKDREANQKNKWRNFISL